MTATNIAAAFERWHELWTANFPTDEAGNAAMEERAALKAHIIGTRAVRSADILAKVRMLYEHARACWVEDEMLASIAADLDHATTASPELVALVSELTAGVDRFCNTPADGPNAITKANDMIWKKIEAFAPRCVADVLAKARAGAIYYGEGIPTEGEEMYASDRIALQMIADLEHLAGKGAAS